MDRSLKDLFGIIADLKAVYDQYQTANKDGKVSLDEGVALADSAFAVLDKHNITVAELKDLLVGVRPLLAFIR